MKPTKQSVPINFAQGLDLKTDPKQVQVGKFLSLENTIFTKGGLLQKRNGFGSLTTLANNDSTYLTTFNNNLTAISNTINAYSDSSNQWYTKGSIQPLSLNTLPLIRSNTNQTQVDIAIASNGFMCTVYTDQNPDNLSEFIYKYVIADSITGQNIIEPTQLLTGTSTSIYGIPRVFLLGNYFIIIYTNDESGVYHLQYIAISIGNPNNTTTPIDINGSSAIYTPSSTLSFDAIVASNNLFIAYNTSSGGQDIKLVKITSNLQVVATSSLLNLTGINFTATLITLTVDISNNNSIYLSFYNSSSSSGYTYIFNEQLQSIINPIQIINNVSVLNMTSSAQNGVCSIYYEVTNTYGYDSTLPTNYINCINISNPITVGGTFNSGSNSVTVASSTGLSSGMYIVDFTTPASIPINTTFTISGSTLTLSNNTTASSPYIFTTSTTSTVSLGETYTNNSHIFTMTSAVMAGHTLTASGTGAPTSTGTLTRTSGSGTTPITFTAVTHSSDTLQAIAISTPITIIRSVGLASKAFIINGIEYFFTVYDDSTTGQNENGIQQTYFLINGTDSIESSPIIISKLAYENAGGYLTTGLPNAIVNGNSVSIPYLYKDLVQSVNKITNASSNTPTAAVYSQTGINYATFTLGSQNFDTVEIASTLNLSGGFHGMYDGYLPVEQNFFLYPSNVEVVPTQNGGALPAQKYYYQAVYEWTDNQGNLYQSAPSVPVLADLTNIGQVNFSAVFNQGWDFHLTSYGFVHATAGATYTDSSSNTWTVLYTIDPSTPETDNYLICSGIGTPPIPSSGSFTLTKTSGTGDATIIYDGAGVINWAQVTSNPIGLYVGQTITDTTTPGNITGGTVIGGIQSGIYGFPGVYIILSNPNAGNSASSPGDTMNGTPVPLTFTAAFDGGSKQMFVSSTTGLFPGQYLTDTTTGSNLQANTYITDIDVVSNVVTVNLPFNASASSDTIETFSVYSSTVNVPTLRLTYKTANPVKIVIYRWSAAQQEYFQVTSIDQPVLNDLSVDYVSFIDTMSDLQILGNNLIYTTGGVVEDVNAPATNIMTLWNTRLWLVDAEDQNTLWYSKQVIEDTPVEMSDLLTLYVAPTIGASGSTGPITALSSMDSNLIIFKKDAIYYVTGQGPDNTGANNNFTDPIFITSVVGCTNQQSVIFTPAGLMFQSDKGIWLLSRNNETSYIGAPVEDFTLTADVVSSVIVPGTNQIRFTLNSGITLMYDYYYQQWGTFVNIPAISSCIYNNLHTYLNSNGQVFQETPNLYLDGSSPTLIQFTTSWLNLAGLQGYQRAFFFYILGQYLTPHKLQVSIAYDYNSAPQQVSIISPDNYSLPYGGDSPYGQGNPYGGPGDLEQWRVFLAKQRCQALQVSIQEVYDSSFGVPAGEGLTISGLNMIVGAKSSFRTIPAKNSVG